MVARLGFLWVPGICLGALGFYFSLVLGFDPLDAENYKLLGRYFKDHRALPPGFAIPLMAGVGLMIAGLFGVQMLGAGVGVRPLRGRHGKKTMPGSAKWANKQDLKRAGLLSKQGVTVGGWQAGHNGPIRALRDDGPTHVLTFAPTRSGKGVGLVVPTLLEWKHSALVLDIKGENFKLTAGWRAKELNQQVLKFDPASSEGSARFNPLAEVRLNTDQEIADVQAISIMIMDPDGKGLKNEWAEWGYDWLTAAIVHVLRVEKKKNRTAGLADVARHLFAAESGAKAMLQRMKDFDHGAGPANELVHGEAQSMLDRADKERSGVLSSARGKLGVYRDPVVAHNTSESDFRLADLTKGGDGVSVYLVVSPEDLKRLRPLLRIFFNLLLTRLKEILAVGRGKPRGRLLLMLDEFAALGKLEVFADAISYIAGYGLKAYVILQDVEQLYKAYGQHQSITSNCRVWVGHATNNFKTAKMLSEEAGTIRVVDESRDETRRFGELRGSVTTRQVVTPQPLLPVEDVMQLPEMEPLGKPGAVKQALAKVSGLGRFPGMEPLGKPGAVKQALAKVPGLGRLGWTHEPGEILIFPLGNRPVRGRQILYFQDKELLRRSEIEPPADYLGRNNGGEGAALLAKEPPQAGGVSRQEKKGASGAKDETVARIRALLDDVGEESGTDGKDEEENGK